MDWCTVSFTLSTTVSLSSSSLSSLLSVCVSLSMQQQRAIRLLYNHWRDIFHFLSLLSPAIPTPDLFVITNLDWRNDSNEVSRVPLFSLSFPHSLPLLHYLFCVLTVQTVIHYLLVVHFPSHFVLRWKVEREDIYTLDPSTSLEYAMHAHASEMATSFVEENEETEGMG